MRGIGWLTVALLASAAAAQLPSVDEARQGSNVFWQQTLVGKVGGAAGARGQGALSTRDVDTVWASDGTWGPWEYGYVILKNGSDGTAGSPFVFGGAAFATGQSFRLDERLTVGHLRRRWTVRHRPGFKVRATAGFTLMDIDLDLRSTAGPGVQGRVHELALMPTFGLTLDWGRGPDRPRPFFSLRGSGVAFGRVDAEMLEAVAGVGYRIPRSRWTVGVGYKLFVLDAEMNAGHGTDSGAFDAQHRGAYLEIGTRW